MYYSIVSYCLIGVTEGIEGLDYHVSGFQYYNPNHFWSRFPVDKLNLDYKFLDANWGHNSEPLDISHISDTTDVLSRL